jgi:hypothetical protein
MFNNLFCRFWQVINLVKKDQHSLKSCVDLFFLNFKFRCLRLLSFNARYKTIPHESWHFISVNRKNKYTIPTPHNFATVDFTIKWNIVSLQIDVMTFKINANKIIWFWNISNEFVAVQWLIKCWINDTVNRKFNCLAAMIF